MLSIVNLYAKEYGWTRNEILDFPLDEHILNEVKAVFRYCTLTIPCGQPFIEVASSLNE